MSGRWRARGVLTASAVVAAVCLVTAALVDLADPRMTTTSTILDVGVGVAFLVLAASASQPALQRMAWFGVGTAWLAATALPALGGLPTAALITGILVLGADPRRRQRIVYWIIAGIVVVVAVGRVPQPVVGMLLFAAAAVLLVFGRRDGRAANGRVAVRTGLPEARTRGVSP